MKQVIAEDKKTKKWKRIVCEDDMLETAFKFIKKQLAFELTYDKEYEEEDMDEEYGIPLGRRLKIMEEREKDIDVLYFDLAEPIPYDPNKTYSEDELLIK